MPVFSLAGAPLSVSQDATRASVLLFYLFEPVLLPFTWNWEDVEKGEDVHKLRGTSYKSQIRS